MKEPSTIKECKEMIDSGDIPKLSDMEKASLIKTFQQNRGEASMKQVKDMSNEELIQMERDCLDTIDYVQSNKASYGMMYDMALDITLKLQNQVIEEKNKRGL